jgi:hypothetical protein
MKILSLGSRELLRFLERRSALRGFCRWKQSTLANQLRCDVRTISRRVKELVESGTLKCEFHGHYNVYIPQQLQPKVSEQENSTASSGKAVELCGKPVDAVLAATTLLSDRISITQTVLGVKERLGVRTGAHPATVFFEPPETPPDTPRLDPLDPPPRVSVSPKPPQMIFEQEGTAAWNGNTSSMS